VRAAGMALAGLLWLGSPAAAQHHCRVPLGDWQPREALQSKLEQQGWTVLGIRADDGCYKVRARNANGERLEGKFDPGSLEPVSSRGDHRGHDGHEHDDEQD
jgi:hypothetical protein